MIGSWRDLAAAANRLAEARSAHADPEDLTRELGVDPEALSQWATADALDSMATTLKVGGPVPAELLAGLLATHTHIGVELGLWLAREARS